MKAKLINISHRPATGGICNFELREECYDREPGALLATLTNTDSDIAEQIAEAWNAYNPEERLHFSSFLDSIIQGDYTLSDAITEATQLKTLLKLE